MQEGSGRLSLSTVLGLAAIFILAGGIFFVLHYRTKTVEVMGSSHYSAQEIKEMVLEGAASYNTVLASAFLGKEGLEDVPYIEGIRVTRTSAHSLMITVREQKILGCMPYLDSYIYFDRNGAMVEGTRTRDPAVPYFSGIRILRVEQNKPMEVAQAAALNAAVILAAVFQKAEPLPDYIAFDDNSRAVLHYGEIEVRLGEEINLEDKVLRILAILPELDGKKGTLHAESVTENNKRITFDQILTYADWLGGYESDGTYNGEGEYDAQGYYVGPAPRGIVIPSIRDITGEGSDEPIIAGQPRKQEDSQKTGQDGDRHQALADKRDTSSEQVGQQHQRGDNTQLNDQIPDSRCGVEDGPHIGCGGCTGNKHHSPPFSVE